MFRKIFGSRSNGKPESIDEQQWIEERVADSLDKTIGESMGLTLTEYRQIKGRYWELADKKNPDLDHHFKLHQRILDTYVAKDRSTWHSTKEVCMEHIEFSDRGASAYLESERDLAERSSFDRTSKPYSPRPLPMHTGYERMCIVLEKEGDFLGVIEFSNRARADGWNGSWDRRIERAERQLAKQGKMARK